MRSLCSHSFLRALCALVLLGLAPDASAQDENSCWHYIIPRVAVGPDDSGWVMYLDIANPGPAAVTPEIEYRDTAGALVAATDPAPLDSIPAGGWASVQVSHVRNDPVTVELRAAERLVVSWRARNDSAVYYESVAELHDPTCKDAPPSDPGDGGGTNPSPPPPDNGGTSAMPTPRAASLGRCVANYAECEVNASADSVDGAYEYDWRYRLRGGSWRNAQSHFPYESSTVFDLPVASCSTARIVIELSVRARDGWNGGGSVVRSWSAPSPSVSLVPSWDECP